MNVKFLLFIVLISIVISAPGLASYQIVPVGKYNVSLDFGGQRMMISPSNTQFEDAATIDLTMLTEESTYTIGSVTIYNFVDPRPVDDLAKSMLKYSVLEGLCARTSIEPYLDGYVQTGLYKDGGHKCWGVCMPLDAKVNATGTGKECTIMVEIIAMFENETLNEHLVKTAKY